MIVASFVRKLFCRAVSSFRNFSSAFPLCIITLFALGNPLPVQADGVVLYQAADLPDQIVGQDLWSYTYQLSGFAFQSGEGFSVFFDDELYANLHSGLPAGSPDWDVLLVQPDVILHQPGLYDALALMNNPALTGPFSVQFIWLGNGTPGAQPFEQYNTSFQTIGTGTSVVPEPQSWALVLMSVLIGLWRRRTTGMRRNLHFA